MEKAKYQSRGICIEVAGTPGKFAGHEVVQFTRPDKEDDRANMVAEAPEPTPDRPSRHPLAGTDAPTADYRTCMETGDAGNGVTSGMRECLGAELKRQDERLNASYQTALAPLSQDDQSTLRSRQRTWLAERDAGCQQKAEPNKGGTLYPIVYGQCLLDATIERAGWLETYSPGKK